MDTRARVHKVACVPFLTIAKDVPRRAVGDELRIKQVLLNLISNAMGARRCVWRGLGAVRIIASFNNPVEYRI